MQDLPGRFEPHLLSLPFAFAPAAMLIVLAYVAVMRGASSLRFWLFIHFSCVLTYSIVMALNPSMASPDVAERAFQIAASLIPLAAASGSAFQLTLVRKVRPLRWLVWLSVANSVVWIVVSCTTHAAVDGIQRLPGLWYAVAGDWAWLALLNTALIAVPGFIALSNAAVFGKPSVERRMLRLVLAANTITYAGLIDVGLAYGIGVFPFGWLLSGVGSLLVVRALVVEDLLRVRAVDTTAPLLVVHLATAILLAWTVLTLVGDSPWWVTAIGLALCFGGTRASIATTAMVMSTRRRGGESPLDRLLAQLVAKARTMTTTQAIAAQAIDSIELAIGVRPIVLVSAADDGGWTTDDGARIRERQAPDPSLMSWLAERRDVLFSDDVDAVPAELQPRAAALFEAHGAHALVPIASADELLALIFVPVTGKRLRGRPLDFLERAAERLAEALLHARMARRAAERANLAREVELAATVQGELLPGRGPHVHGDITVVGSWQPATRCAGDFWGVYPLGDGRVLVTIGDVTGHGVASAMVTAAAAGACDVVVRRSGDALDLQELAGALDAAVRRAGGGQLEMTCFAAILDPAAREVRFVSCGHTAPYLCRPTERAVELHALVGRGNPLGAGAPSAPKVLQKPLQAGDVLVWYTDGVIEAQDPGGTPYGDRRLQHLLRRLDRARLSAPAIHDVVLAEVAAHRAGHPLADDETLVVAQLAAQEVAS